MAIIQSFGAELSAGWNGDCGLTKSKRAPTLLDGFRAMSKAAPIVSVAGDPDGGMAALKSASQAVEPDELMQDARMFARV
jgi:hypothetical protein